MEEETYSLVQLPNQAFSIRSEQNRETFHPVVGPSVESDSLYVSQLKLAERIAREPGPFVVWDVGLGAAANALALLRGTREAKGEMQLLSFDRTLRPLEFAWQHQDQLGYFAGYKPTLTGLLMNPSQGVRFTNGATDIDWRIQLADFPTLLRDEAMAEQRGMRRNLPRPHAILFDPYSPAKNPAMWTLSLFRNLFACLDPARPCAIPTYSRSTLLRVTLLIAGFYVGWGVATGEKEQTTVAANSLPLIDHPLDRAWLQRAHRSTSAEPLTGDHYLQQPLTSATRARLQDHPQFQSQSEKP